MTRPQRLVICGTDTDVGKTVVSALFVQGLGACYWKPVQSGLEGGGDAARVQRLLNLPRERLIPEAYRLRQPVSPHWAAELEGVTIEPSRLGLPRCDRALVVETAGGLLVPLGRDWLQIDQLQRWGLPVLLVGRSGEPFSRGEILKEVWGYTPERHVDTRVVDVHISRLRSKLEDDPANPELILTARGTGYLFQRIVEPVASEAN